MARTIITRKIWRKEEFIWGLVTGDRKKFGLESRDRRPEGLLGEGIQAYVEDRLWKRGSRRYRQMDFFWVEYYTGEIVLKYWWMSKYGTEKGTPKYGKSQPKGKNGNGRRKTPVSKSSKEWAEKRSGAGLFFLTWMRWGLVRWCPYSSVNKPFVFFNYRREKRDCCV